MRPEDPKTLQSLSLTSLSALADCRGNEGDDRSNDSRSSSGSKTNCKKKWKQKQSSKAIATAKVLVELPELDKWAEEFRSFHRVTRDVNAPMQLLPDLIDRCCKKDWLKAQVKQISNCCSTPGEVRASLGNMVL